MVLNSTLKNYLIGILNILITTALAGSLGVLLIFQIKAYELAVSHAFSLSFFSYDIFATKLIFLLLVALIVNAISAVICISNMYPFPVVQTAIIFSMSSIIWLILFFTTNFAIKNYLFIPVVILMLILLALLSNQLKNRSFKICLIVVSLVIFVSSVFQ